MVRAAHFPVPCAARLAASGRTRPAPCADGPPISGSPATGRKPRSSGRPSAGIRTVPNRAAHLKTTEFQRFGTGGTDYLYRWYNPVTGRWPSRDPIEEEGGLNLYSFVGNDGIQKHDYLGRNPALAAEAFAAGSGTTATAALVAAAYGLNTAECRADPKCNAALTLIENPTVTLWIAGHVALCKCKDLVKELSKSKRCRLKRQLSGPSVMSGATLCTYDCDGVERYMNLRSGNCDEEVDADNPKLD
jgi:RHS repeat-associated protein